MLYVNCDRGPGGGTCGVDSGRRGLMCFPKIILQPGHGACASAFGCLSVKSFSEKSYWCNAGVQVFGLNLWGKSALLTL